MSTGTIADVDETGAFGVIDSDEGDVLLFNLNGVPASRWSQFQVGARVEFEADHGPIAPRAVGLRLAESPSRHAH